MLAVVHENLIATNKNAGWLTPRHRYFSSLCSNGNTGRDDMPYYIQCHAVLLWAILRARTVQLVNSWWTVFKACHFISLTRFAHLGSKKVFHELTVFAYATFITFDHNSQISMKTVFIKNRGAVQLWELFVYRRKRSQTYCHDCRPATVYIIPLGSKYT